MTPVLLLWHPFFVLFFICFCFAVMHGQGSFGKTLKKNKILKKDNTQDTIKTFIFLPDHCIAYFCVDKYLCFWNVINTQNIKIFSFCWITQFCMVWFLYNAVWDFIATFIFPNYYRPRLPYFSTLRLSKI